MKARFIYIALLLIALCSLLAPGSGRAQGTDLPDVEMVINNYDYMISLFPDDYENRRQAIRACSTIVSESEELKAFWDEQGDIVLYYLSYYSGINWVEPEFNIYLVKYFPDFAAHNPMTIPLAGKKNGNQIIAVPEGLSHYITLFQQLSRRLLEQTSYPGASQYFISGHPLMRKSPRRFDNLANLLALRTLSDFTNVDSVLTVFKSAHWKNREPGQEVLFNYFWEKWNLSADSTLAAYIAAEPYGSRVVAMTRPPARKRTQQTGWGDHQLQAPTAGRLGFSVVKNRGGFYRVVDIDSLKLAFASGLRVDDLIRNIDGASARNIKQLFSKVLEKLDNGVHINIVRNDEPDAVIIYPWTDIPYPKEYIPVEQYPEDSTDNQ